MSSRIDLSEHAEKARTFLDEFKRFAFKGNVVDLAVGFIIGTAFGGVVKSLVDHVFMPIFGMIMPGQSEYEKWALGQVKIGLFIGAIINFLIVSFVLYVFIVRFLGWLTKAKEKEQPPLTKDQQLLTEIRDLLKAQA